MPTAREILVEKSGYLANTASARTRMKALGSGSVVIAPPVEKIVKQIIRTTEPAKKKSFRLPPVQILDNSPAAIQQALDEVLTSVRRGLS